VSDQHAEQSRRGSIRRLPPLSLVLMIVVLLWFGGGTTLDVPRAAADTDVVATSWTWQYPVPQGYSLTAVASVGSHVWAVGVSGTIVASTDHGVTWSVQQSGVDVTLWKVAFVDEQHGWVVGDAGTVLSTGDGGSTWTQRDTGVLDSLDGVTFVDENHGWVFSHTYGGESPCILVSDDGGRTWSKRHHCPVGERQA